MERFSNNSSAGSADAADDGSARDPSPNLYARIRIVNHAQLAGAYGDDAASTVMAAIARRVGQVLEGRGSVAQRGDGFDLSADLPTTFPLGARTAPHDPVGALERAFGTLCAEPIEHEGKTLFASVAVVACQKPRAGSKPDAHAFEAARNALDETLRERCPRLAPPDRGARWTARYLADMRCAVLVHQAMAEARVFLTWQPIRVGEDGQRLLYSEGLARIVDVDGAFGPDEIVLPGDFVPALERLGLARAFDAHIVRLAIERLERDPRSRLGCNISAQSAVVDGWWTDIIARLAAAPELAARLTLEITETARLPSLGMAVLFRRAMGRLHCQVAVDDFGCSPLSVSNLMALAPDVIKIDAFFLRSAVQGRDQATLGNLIGLCSGVAKSVVIEGVANLAAHAQAMHAGGYWLQGNFMGAPALTLTADAAEPHVDVATAATSSAQYQTLSAPHQFGGQVGPWQLALAPFDAQPKEPVLRIAPQRLALIFGMALLLWVLIGTGIRTLVR